LKLHPYGYRAWPDSAQTLALMERAADFRAPVLFHCGDEECTFPLMIARAAAKVPRATVILGHMGGYFHVDEALRVAQRLDNIVLETSAMPYPWKIKEAVEAIGAKRVLFASDGPGCDPGLELYKVRRARLGKKAEALVLGKNIQRILDSVKRG
jgi:predicted TIM-barrel fold metal-dependent hydrolase